MLRIFTFLLVLVTAAAEALAQSSWTNGSTVSGNWNSNKWANGAPTTSSDVYITNQGGGGIYTVTLTNYAAINSLTLSAPSTATNTFKLSNAGGLGSLYLSNGMTVGAGSIFDPNGQTVTGSVTIASGGRMAATMTASAGLPTIAGVVSNQGSIRVIQASSSTPRQWGGLVNDGSFLYDFSAATGTALQFANASSLKLNAGGFFTITNRGLSSSILVISYDGGSVLTNFGTVTIYANSTNTSRGGASLGVGSGSSVGGSNLLLNAANGKIFLTTMGGTNAGFPIYTESASLSAFLRNEGTLTVSGTNISRIMGTAVSGISTNAGLIVIDDQAGLDFYIGTANKGHSLVNQSGGALSIGQRSTLRLLSVNAGQVSGGAGFFRNEGVVTNLGSITTLFNLTNAVGASLVSAGNFSTSVVNQGSMAFLAGTSSVAVGTLANPGNLDFQSGSVLSLASPFLNQGTVVGSGTVLVNAATNSGTFSPGHSPGTLAFSSNLTLTSSSILNIELGGTNAVDYDHLVALGALTLGGTLNVTLINGYTPTSGDAVDILDWGLIAGTFATINLPSAQWSFANLYNDGTLIYSAIPEPGIVWGVIVGSGLLALLRRARRMC